MRQIYPPALVKTCNRNNYCYSFLYYITQFYHSPLPIYISSGIFFHIAKCIKHFISNHTGIHFLVPYLLNFTFVNGHFIALFPILNICFNCCFNWKHYFHTSEITVLLPKHTLTGYPLPDFAIIFHLNSSGQLCQSLKVLENLPFWKSETSVFLGEAVFCLSKYNPITPEGWRSN